MLSFDLNWIIRVHSERIRDERYFLFSYSFFYLFYAFRSTARESRNKQNSLLAKKLRISQKPGHQEVNYQKWMNKTLAFIQHKGKICLKLAGRTKSNLQYCLSQLIDNSAQTNLLFSFEKLISSQFKVSLDSMDPNIILYQCYCNKSKPITLETIQFLPPQKEKEVKNLTNEIKIIHFNQQLTVLQVFKLNSELICLFCSNYFEDKKISLMITYNIKEKFTLNYLLFNNIAFYKIRYFPTTNYSFSVVQNHATFDAFASDNSKTLYFQLQPKSYDKKQDTILTGHTLLADKNDIFACSNSAISIYPKISKKAIYSKFLQTLVPQSEFISTVLSLLD